MNAEQLIAAFQRSGDDPEHVLQLRKLVVASAISGRLSVSDQQFNSDEIIKATEAVKAKLVKAGVIPKPKALPAITEEDLPTDFDPSLTYVPLGQLARVEKGLTGIKDAKPGPFPLVVTAAERGTCDHFDFKGPAAIVPLVSSTGHGNASINRLHYQEGDFALGTILAAIRPYDPETTSARFLFEYLTSFKDELLVARMTGSANVTLTLGKLMAAPVPVVCPALQKRVAELMGLLDQLEQTRVRAEGVRTRLTTATLARLTTDAADNLQSARNTDFALKILPALTTTSTQIKTLRQTILNLAVRGKLVPQDANDEPASVLLERIASEKSQLGIRRTMDGCEATELPFVLPNGWVKSSIGEICSKTGSGSTPRGGKEVYKAEGIPFLRSQNVYDDGLRLDDVAYVSPNVHQRMSGTEVKAGDLLLNITGGSMGRCCRIPDVFDTANVSQHVAIIRPAILGMSDFLHQLVLSPYFQAFIFGEQTGAGRGGLPKNRMDRIAVALPPLAEQHRIVAKVDALMALCDQLEKVLTTTANTRARLLETLIRNALSPDAKLPEAAE